VSFISSDVTNIHGVRACLQMYKRSKKIRI
jgi:hypothetical protein